MRELELLAPAANKEIARQAILHGADAVYMGGPSHGARYKATNSIEDIAETVRFAHIFRAKVYVTVNTIVFDKEIKSVERLVSDLYRVGVDAIIVQDMGILRMNIPPIQIHASTQCDTRTIEKAIFLERAGFSQIVLARELSITEIKEICEAVTVPVECFVHGALCVSYSGRCQASHYCMGRSANRGECGQMCRLPYTLRNSKGEVIEKDRYLLSLSDFNASTHIEELIEAGVTSFKIEGRLKDATYVKNVTAAYRNIIDACIAKHPDKYRRSSVGKVDVDFVPSLEKSFNRGFTDYFLPGRGSRRMASIFTPKSLGEPISKIKDLNNGDGISFYNPLKGEYEGVRVNRIENNRILPARKIYIPNNVEIRRTFDVEWQKKMEGKTAERRIRVDFEIDFGGLTACDERGLSIRIPLDTEIAEAKKPMEVRRYFEKLGNTHFYLGEFRNKLSVSSFIPASRLTSLRRQALECLEESNRASYPFEYRRKEQTCYPYPNKTLVSRDNVANSLSQRFYREHGVERIAKAAEIEEGIDVGRGVAVMSMRYCIRRELGCCKKDIKNKELSMKLSEPLTISTGPNTFTLNFDCKRCEMNVIYKGLEYLD